MDNVTVGANIRSERLCEVVGVSEKPDAWQELQDTDLDEAVVKIETVFSACRQLLLTKNKCGATERVLGVRVLGVSSLVVAKVSERRE